MIKKIVAIIMVAVLAVTAPVLARNIPDTAKPTLVSELYETAKKLGGYEKMCAASMHQCPQPMVLISEQYDEYAYGVFNPFKETDRVILSMGNLKPGTIAWNATLVHEFTHYFQWLAGEFGPSTLSCSLMAKIEIDAYTVAAAYLKSIGVDEDMQEEKDQMVLNAAFCVMSGGKP